MQKPPTTAVDSDFDEFLRSEGIFEEVEARAITNVVARLIEQGMAESRVTKSELARRMGTSRAQLDRLLDPERSSATLSTVARVAAALGKTMLITFEGPSRG